MRVVLRRPGPDDEEAFRRACSAVGTCVADFVPFSADLDSFSAWLARLDAVREGRSPCAAGVPFTLLLGFEGDEIVGSVSLRHALTESLRRIGGHIGFYTLPAHRRRGVATAMLNQALVAANEMGLNRVLVTCDEDNVGSRRAIERNGGVAEDVMVLSGRPERVMRYWIEIADSSRYAARQGKR